MWPSWVAYLDLAVECLLIANLRRNGLFRIYRFFFAYLAADALETIAGVAFQSNRRVYAEVYFAGQGIKIVLAIFVVLEIHRLMLERHAALANFWRNVVGYVILAAGCAAGLSVALDRAIPPGRPPLVHRFNTFERTMDLWMLVFLMIAAVFMTWFPLRLPRNRRIYVFGFILYFLARSAGILFRNLAPQWRGPIDQALLLASVFCLFVWLLVMNPQGEAVHPQTGRGLSHDSARESARFSAQLDAINKKLMNLSR